MTAEIVVANKWGIAIAADSAVTSTQWHKGQLREKVLQAANKVFALSKWEPVSAMIYNSVTLGGTPWETLIKLARAKLGRDKFDQLPEYGEFIWKFIESNPHVVPEENARWIARINMIRLISQFSSETIEQRKFKENIDAEISRLETVARLDNFDTKLESTIPTYYDTEISRTISLLPSRLQSGNKTRITKLVQLAFTRQEKLRDYTGLVISGYGSSDVLPRVTDYISDIIVCGRPRYWQRASESVTAINNSLVLPFADTEVIDTLLDGINPRFKRKQNTQAIETIVGIAHKVIDEISELSSDKRKEYKGAASKSIVDSFVEFSKAMDNYMKEELRYPIESTIGLLPVSDLAIVAETLLNASQIHKRVNPETETVGGPVDVAVLTKGDGLVWIKRKHYFSKDLNPAFIGRYLDE